MSTFFLAILGGRGGGGTSTVRYFRESSKKQLFLKRGKVFFLRWKYYAMCQTGLKEPEWYNVWLIQIVVELWIGCFVGMGVAFIIAAIHLIQVSNSSTVRGNKKGPMLNWPSSLNF